MLDAFRRASQTWFIKILFALLVLAFGSWGIGDVIRIRAEQTPAIVVGSENITAEELTEAFKRDVEQLAPAFGGKLSIEQAKQIGLLQRSITQMVGRSLLDQAAESLWLEPDDETLRKAIANVPAFQNQMNSFDKAVYQRALVRAGFSERQFVSLERHDMARERLTRLVGEGVTFPQQAAQALFSYHNEKRVAETVTFTADAMPAPAKPDDAALQDFYKAHASLFMAPELRALSAVVIRAADVSGDIKIPDQDVEKAYQARMGEFQTTEKRSIQQVLFDDQAKAQAFADGARQAKSFKEAAKAAGQEVADLGWVDRKDMSIESLAVAAFAPAGPAVVGPVQSPLGWHVMAVSQVVPGVTRPLADVRSQIVLDLSKDEATNRLYTLSTRLEDSVGAGAGIDEAAAAVNVKPLRVAAVDDHGRGPDGKPPADLPSAPEFIAAAFQAAQGATGEVTGFKDGSGYFVIHVDKVTAAQQRPFDEVKEQVLAAWTRDARNQQALREAEAAAERLRKGEALAAVARAPLSVETTKPLLRGGDGQTPPSPLVAELFKLGHVGDVAVVTVKDGAMVARLKTVIAADPNDPALQQMRSQLAQSMASDLVQQYVGALEKDLGVHINTAVIDEQIQK